MQPRLKSSKKWTAFPREYMDQIQAVFRENFGTQLADDKLIIEGRIYPAEITLRVGILKEGQLRQTNFEVSMDYTAKDAVERIHNCIDAAASMMMDYFENDGEVDFPKTWKAYPFQKETIYLQSSTVNSELESAADKLLGVEDEGMVHGSEDDQADDELPDSDDEDGDDPKKKLH